MTSLSAGGSGEFLCLLSAAQVNCTDWMESRGISPAGWGQRELNECGVAPPLIQSTESSEEESGGLCSQVAGLFLLWKKTFQKSLLHALLVGEEKLQLRPLFHLQGE